LSGYAGALPEAPYKHKGYLKHPTPRAAYAAMITHMDQGIGQIVERVDDLRLSNNTLILFTSDNGPTYDRLGGSDSAFFRSSGNLRGLKGSVYEGGIRVPLVVRWPGHTPAGATIDAPAAFWDLLPTLCEVAGAVPPKDADGLSLLPTLTGQPQLERREFLYWEFPAYGGQQAVRLGPWKGVRPNIAGGNRNLELYNLADDAAESHNVALQHPNVVEQCEAILQSEHVASDVFPLFPDEGADLSKRPARRVRPVAADSARANQIDN
jgi:arylsulfatase